MKEQHFVINKISLCEKLKDQVQTFSLFVVVVVGKQINQAFH